MTRTVLHLLLVVALVGSSACGKLGPPLRAGDVHAQHAHAADEPCDEEKAAPAAPPETP